MPGIILSDLVIREGEKLAHGPTDDAPAKDIQNSDQV